MDPKAKLLLMFVDLVLPLSAGYALRRTTRLPMKIFDRLMFLNLVVIVTSMGVIGFWDMKFERALLWLPVMGILQQVVGGAFGFARAHWKYPDPHEKGGYILAAMLSNRGNVGMLSMFVLYGEEGYRFSQLTICLSLPVVLLFCYPLAAYFSGKAGAYTQSERSLLRRVALNPRQLPLLGVAVGILLYLSGHSRPEFFGQVFPWLVHVAAWCFLVPIGFSMEFSEMRRYWRNVVDLLGVKFILSPLVVTAVAYLVGLRGPALAAVLVLSCAPTAINAVVASKLHNLDIHLPVTAFIFTTLVYVAVVFPLFVIFLPT